MPTTRHHLNNLRRRQAREALRTPGASDAAPSREAPSTPATTVAARPREAVRTSATSDATRSRTDVTRPREGLHTSATSKKVAPAPEDTDPPHETPPRGPAPRRTFVTLCTLCLVILVLGGFAGWAHARAEALRDAPAARNTALSDTARTSEIKGQSAKAVGALFSYDHADPRALDKAAKEWLTGRAVTQHRNLLGDIRERAGKQKAVITTTVTDSAVERIDGDRARVLVYADQSSVSTAGDKKAADDGTYAGAMFALDVERHDGRWLVSAVDTFSR
ncbi:MULTISPECIES: hypothetical protein [unclassified Streptomyces]|uniref:hypothetical protein n=1 Tax=unclassified Streptomyces TaxID=2593676 RepID=UPI0034040F3A